MPLHTTGLASRRDLAHPEGEPTKIIAPALELVLKYDPSQPRDAAGRWTSGGRSGRHGTAGPPTEDAFGRSLRRGNLPTYSGGGKTTLSGGFTSRGALQRGGIDDGMLRGEPPKTDPNFHKGSNAPAFDSHFNRDTGTISGYGGSTGPYKKAFRGVKDTHTGSIKNGKPTQRSSFS